MIKCFLWKQICFRRKHFFVYEIHFFDNEQPENQVFS